MPYLISDNAGEIGRWLNSFMFYMPFTLSETGSIGLNRANGCFLAVLLHGRPNDPIPPKPNWHEGLPAKETVRIESTDGAGTLKFEHLKLVNEVEMERENEWCELRIYGGDMPETTANWISTDNWSRRESERIQPANHFKKYFDFGTIKDASCDESLVVLGDRGLPRCITLGRRMVSGTIAEVIMQTSAKFGKDRMPELTLMTEGGSEHVRGVGKRVFFSAEGRQASGVARSGYVLIAAGMFAYQSADTLLEEWQMGRKLEFDRVRRRLGEIIFGPNNEFQLRQLRNIDHTEVKLNAGAATIDDIPIEVLYVATHDERGNLS